MTYISWSERKELALKSLIGLTFKSIERNEADDEITFTTTDDRVFFMYHSQDCCESVSIEDITGDLEDLIGNPILVAEERTNDEDDVPPEVLAEREKAKAEFVPQYEGQTYYDYRNESETWTFYEFATIKGSVTIRWHGSSNGYYSESVDFIERVKSED